MLATADGHYLITGSSGTKGFVHVVDGLGNLIGESTYKEISSLLDIAAIIPDGPNRYMLLVDTTGVYDNQARGNSIFLLLIDGNGYLIQE